ncbi:MAG: peroxidase [Simplicispira sp.]|nr:peroxidase [Simplicispira sp.]
MTAFALTATRPKEGFELAITLNRRGVKCRPTWKRSIGCGQYAPSADGLTAASQVIAINFQTVSAANNYWRKWLIKKNRSSAYP